MSVTITRKGNKIEVYSEFTNMVYKGFVDSKGYIRSKDPLALRMIHKALEMEVNHDA